MEDEQGLSVRNQKLVYGNFFQILHTDLETERGFSKFGNTNNLDKLPKKNYEARGKKVFCTINNIKQISTNNDRGKKNHLSTLSVENFIKLSYAERIKERVSRYLVKTVCSFPEFYEFCGICQPSKSVISVMHFSFLNKY